MEIKLSNEINAYLVFKIGDEDYAANASKVQRILELQQITSIPRVPKYVKGVINLMGKVLPVVDARMKMGMEEKEADTNTCIVVLEITKNNQVVETGIIVDSVQSVLEIQKEEIKDPPTLGFDVNTDFIMGMVENQNKFIMLLDVDNVFSTAEVVSIDNISNIEVPELTKEE
jgi:purine-binding chemotaxis protein CheW